MKSYWSRRDTTQSPGGPGGAWVAGLRPREHQSLHCFFSAPPRRAIGRAGDSPARGLGRGRTGSLDEGREKGTSSPPEKALRLSPPAPHRGHEERRHPSRPRAGRTGGNGVDRGHGLSPRLQPVWRPTRKEGGGVAEGLQASTLGRRQRKLDDLIFSKPPSVTAPPGRSALQTGGRRSCILLPAPSAPDHRAPVLANTRGRLRLSRGRDLR